MGGEQCVGSFTSVQDFWYLWTSISIERMLPHSSLSVFKDPSKPMWEDEHKNINENINLPVGHYSPSWCTSPQA